MGLEQVSTRVSGPDPEPVTPELRSEARITVNYFGPDRSICKLYIYVLLPIIRYSPKYDRNSQVALYLCL